MFLHYKIKPKSSQITPKSGFGGPKIPSEVGLQHETCSTLYGTHVQTILNQKKLTGLAGGESGKVKIGQNIAQNWPRFWLWSPLEAPKWVKDP